MITDEGNSDDNLVCRVTITDVQYLNDKMKEIQGMSQDYNCAGNNYVQPNSTAKINGVLSLIRIGNTSELR